MKIFEFCPHCGSRDIIFDGIKQFHCKSCSFIYFQNVAAAAAAILQYGDRIILIRRNNEPGKGKLDLPGGFVDPKENAENALKREIKEELNIDIDIEKVKYLCSYPNIYEYKGVRYNTCDLFFYSRIDALPAVLDKTEIAEMLLIKPAELPLDKIAFESVRNGLAFFAGKLQSLPSD